MQKDYNEKKYFMHYLTHTYLVVLAWKEIQDILIENDLLNKDEIEKINHLILWHDNSKISSEEWLPYARKFHPIGENQDTNKTKTEFKKAVAHHKRINLHHFESLKNYDGPDWKCYVIELICDYIAMGWEFNNYIFEYYNRNKENIDLPIVYKEYLEQILNLLTSASLHFVEEPLTLKRMSFLHFK